MHLPQYNPEPPTEKLTDPNHPMHDNIVLAAYPKPDQVGGWAGFIEDKNRTWIIWFGPDGRPSLYHGERDEEGGVVGDGIALGSPDAA